MRHPIRAVFAFAALLSFAGCNCGAGPDPGGDGGTEDGGLVDAGDLSELRSLELTPTDATLTARDSTPAVQAYAVTGRFSDDSTRDLTASASFALDDPRLGAFHRHTFTSSTEVGGHTIVRATVGDASAETPLTLVLQKQFSDPDPGSSTLPGNPENMFGGTPSASRAPQLVYPNDGVLVPPNLGKLEFHFRKGHASNTLFELAFSNATTDVRIHLRCYMPTGVPQPDGISDGCIYTPSPAVWSHLAETNRGADPLQVRLRATDDSGSGPVGTSEPISIRIARSELKGALYYWTTSAGTGVMRYDFAGPSQAAAERVLGRDQAEGNCIGCHALSRDGKKIVASANGQHNGQVLLHDLSTDTAKVRFDSTPRSQFFAWNPEGTRFAGVYADSGADDYRVMLFDGDTAEKLSSIDGTGTSNNPASHPDWSPDGKTVVYARMGIKNTNQRFYKGSIRAVEQGAGGAWGTPYTVAPESSGKNRFYPAVAPDSRYLVFNESSCPSGEQHRDCNADTDPTTTLWTARLIANAPRVKLERASGPGVMDGANVNLANTFPKWSPFEVRGSNGASSRLHWVTFSSTRMYGLRKPVGGGDENPSGTLLWMAAVDPDQAAQDRDGSFPAFALPFQDLGTSNHIAQWAQYAVVDGCVTEGDGCQTGGGGAACCNGLTCTSLSTDPPLPCDREGNCVCREQSTCAVTGEACSATTPCCGTLACQNAVGGGACTGDDCLCQPACGGVGQACGGGAGACCGGLLCLGSTGGACTGDGCACRIGID